MTLQLMQVDAGRIEETKESCIQFMFENLAEEKFTFTLVGAEEIKAFEQTLGQAAIAIRDMEKNKALGVTKRKLDVN